MTPLNGNYALNFLKNILNDDENFSILIGLSIMFQNIHIIYDQFTEILKL